MKSRTAWKKGAILLQTLVMSVILSMIAIMIMKWVLLRYSLVGRMHRSLTANTRGEGYMFSSLPCATTVWKAGGACPNWQLSGGIAPSSLTLDTPAKSFSMTVSGSITGTSVQTVSVTTEQDQ